MAVVLTPHSAYLSRATAWNYNAAYTCAFWLTPTSYSSSPYILHIGDLADNNADLFLLEDSAGTRKVTAAVRSGGATTAHALQGSGIALNTNYHFAAVRANTTTFYVYVNGVLLNTVSRDVSARAALDHWYIGKVPSNGTNIATVNVAHMKVWTAALSDAEIALERLSASPVRTADLWADYQFADGALATDSSGNSRTLTLNGSPVFTADPALSPSAAIVSLLGGRYRR